MIEVYVREIGSDRGELLGEFSPDQIPLLPTLFMTFKTSSVEGDDCVYSCSRFVIDNGQAFFEILVEKED